MVLFGWLIMFLLVVVGRIFWLLILMFVGRVVFFVDINVGMILIWVMGVLILILVGICVGYFSIIGIWMLFLNRVIFYFLYGVFIFGKLI